MADINLLQTPSAHTSTISTRGRVFLSRLLMFILIVVVLSFGLLKFLTWQSGKSITETQARVAAAQSEALNNKDRKELITRQGQLKALNNLVDDHMYWSYFLPELSKVTLRSAAYSQISMDEQGKLLVTVTLPTYEDLEKYMQIFDLPEYNQHISNVKILSITRQQLTDSLQTVVRLELTFDSAYLKGKM